MPGPDNNAEPSTVLVVGGGLAGVTAAIAAAEAGAQVTIACTGRLFGGSSFRPATWGLGLVAPDGPGDDEDLARTILDIGGGAADEALVRSFVAGIAPAVAWVAWLEAQGVALKRPRNPDEREFVPCFDHKHRRWYGLEREPVQLALAKRIRQLGIRVHEGWELLDVRRAGGPRANGGDPLLALLLDRASGRAVVAESRSVVVATGGCGGLFERRLGAAEDTGAGHACALRLGACLTNMEFMQIMPGLVGRGDGLVFNEKMFRWARLADDAGRDALAPAAAALGIEARKALDARACHGPFTSRLDSRAVDLALNTAGPDGLRVRPAAAALGIEARKALDARACHGPFTSRLDSRAVDLALNTAGPDGLRVRFADADGRPLSEASLPEFAQTYFRWLREACGLGADNESRVALFAHASNGGIAVDEHGRTAADGLFACGECTGGMHGADRLGGLSSANCLVFGLRAGKEAARRTARSASSKPYAIPESWQRPLAQASTDEAPVRETLRRVRSIMAGACMVGRSGASSKPYAIPESWQRPLAQASTDEAPVRETLRRVRSIMAGACMVGRSEAVLTDARAQLAEMRRCAEEAATIENLQRANAINAAQAMVDAALARTESLGSHHRCDSEERRP